MSLYTKEFASDRLTNEIQQLDMQITSLQKEKHEGKLTDVGATYLKELTKKSLDLVLVTITPLESHLILMY